MIESVCWKQNEGSLSYNSMISADSLSDLGTEKNCISTWLVQNLSESEIKKAIQALSSGFRTLDCIDIVVLDYKQLLKAGFTIEETEGDTRIDICKSLHRDISHLNAGSLSRLAEFILKNIWDENVRNIPKDKVGEWLFDAMQNNILDFSKLEKNMKTNLASFIDKKIKKNIINKSKIPQDILDIINNQILLNSRQTNCQYEANCEKYKNIHRM